MHLAPLPPAAKVSSIAISEILALPEPAGTRITRDRSDPISPHSTAARCGGHISEAEMPSATPPGPVPLASSVAYRRHALPFPAASPSTDHADLDAMGPAMLRTP